MDLSAFGPTTGDPALDALTTQIGLELFLDARCATALADAWLRTFSDRPRDPLPGPSFVALLDLVLTGTAACDLRIVGYQPTPAQVAYMLVFFPDRGNALKIGYTPLKAMGAVGTCDAVAKLLHKQHTERPTPFDSATLCSVEGDLDVRAFRGNARLRHYFDPVFFVCLLCRLFARCLAWPTLLTGHSREVLCAINGAVANALARHADAASMHDPARSAILMGLARAFRAHLYTPSDLVVAVEEASAPIVEHMQQVCGNLQDALDRLGDEEEEEEEDKL